MKTTLASIWLIACAAQPARTATVLQTPQSELQAWATERGARPQDVGEEFLAPGGSFVREFELDEGCHLFFVVVAQGIRDADLGLWSPDGELLVADEAPDARPVVQICGARRIFARVSAPAGAGTAALHHFRAATAIALDGLGDGAATYEAQSASELDRALASRGYRRGRDWTFDVNEDDPVEIGLGDEQGCFALIAEGTPVQVRVLSGAGERVRGAGDPAALQWCSSRSQPLRAYIEGAGTVQLRIYRATQERAGGTPGLWLGDRSRAVE